jgi:hypothetical protein
VDVPLIRELISAKWNRDRCALPNCLKANVPVEPAEYFIKDSYWACVFEHVEEKARKTNKAPVVSRSASAGSNEASSANNVYDISCILDDSAFKDMAVYHQVSVARANEDDVYMSSRSVHEDTVPSEGNAYQGWVISHDAEPRTAACPTSSSSPSPQKRTVNGELKEVKNVLDLLVLDCTGPIRVTLWGECATQFLSLKARAIGEQTNIKPVITLRDFKMISHPVNKWNGAIETSVKVLSSKYNTILRVSKEGTSPYLQTGRFTKPGTISCISSFLSVHARMMTRPWRGTFSGVVMDCEGLSDTQSGQPKKLFNLVDDSGTWFRCGALGVHALSKLLENNNEVVLYFCSAFPPVNGQVSTVWLMKEAFVAMLSTVATPPVKRKCIVW